MSDLDPSSPLGQHLKQKILQELVNSNVADDANDIADYILVMIHNEKTPNEVLSEITGIFGDVITEGFVQAVFNEIVLMRNGGGAQQEVQPEQQQQQQQAAAQQQVPAQQQSQPAPEEQPHKQVGFQQQTVEHPSSIPTAPKMYTNNKFNGGVGKFGAGTKRNNNFAMRNEANFKKALGMVGQPIGAGVNGAAKPFIQKKAVGRCRQHPYCTNRECPFSHPSKLCFAYPNCTNAPGTCNYLHPGEDDALFAAVANVKALKESNRQEVQQQFYSARSSKFQHQKQPHQQAAAPETVACKFGSVCQKESCPFAHPTPANRAAQVSEFEWCPEAGNCSNGSCNKAHPSPNYKPSAEEQQQQQQKLLEQCKFGAKCSNYKCPRRHATSPVLCREGANCTRLDCYFTHPIDEDCRFGVNCMNNNCPYKHPEGRASATNKWVANSQTTSQRTFAVPEDEVMEHAPPQEAN